MILRHWPCWRILVALWLGMVAAIAQEPTHMPLIGDPAPAFTAKTTQGPINFPADYAGKWVVFFSHPADFTPVCTTEFMTFASRQPDFDAINTKLVGLSIDGLYSHIAWLRNIQRLNYQGIANVMVTFPLIDDVSMDIAKKYGMLHPNASGTQTVRAVFIVDPKGIVRSLLYYPMSTGRNIDEIMRMVIAMQTADKFGVATPANWQPGKDVIIPPPGSCGSAAERMQQSGQGYVAQDWFFSFKPLPARELMLPPSMRQ